MFCKYCGSEIPENSLFCPGCGSPVAVPPVAELQPEPVVPAEPVIAADAAEEFIPEEAEEIDSVEGVFDGVRFVDANWDDDAVPAPEESFEEAETIDPAPAYEAGAAFKEAEPPVYETESAAGQPQKKKKAWIWIVIAAAAVLIIAAVVIALSVTSKHKKQYNQAQDDYASRDYALAAEEFDELGKYKDSAEMSQLAYKWLDAIDAEKKAAQDPESWEKAAQLYEQIDEAEAAKAAVNCHNTATYYQAVKQMDKSSGDAEGLSKAIELFEKCKDTKDSNEKIAECENEIDYLAAVALMESGDLEGAAEKFDELGDNYRDASELAQECRNEMIYLSAEALKDAGSWNDAQDLYDQILDYKDSYDLSEYCYTHSVYDEAVAAYYDGRYYDAYKMLGKVIYNSYDDLPDLWEAREGCKQPYPANGVVYRNPDYATGTVELTIDNTGYMNTYKKLYMGDTLVLTIFIVEDGETTFSLPAGTYSMNESYGDDWFGTTDLFGDEGYYWKCNFGGSETFTLEAYNGYIISAGGEGTSIGNESTSRNDF